MVIAEPSSLLWEEKDRRNMSGTNHWHITDQLENLASIKFLPPQVVKMSYKLVSLTAWPCDSLYIGVDGLCHTGP